MPPLRMLPVEPSNIAGKKLETSKATPLDNFRRQSELVYFQTKLWLTNNNDNGTCENDSWTRTCLSLWVMTRDDGTCVDINHSENAFILPADRYTSLIPI